MRVPFVDLDPIHRPIKKEIMQLWEEIYDSSQFIGGEQVQSFEYEYAQYCRVKHCVTTGSGTDALRFILCALGVKSGDEVILPANTFIATSEAVSQSGGNPVFVDIEPDTLTISAECIEKAITHRTRGIIPVHLYGQLADMDAILDIADRHGLWVVEDACQAHGAQFNSMRSGSFGVGAAFSFYPGKNLGACGEAGAVTTSDIDIDRKVRMLRDHGQVERYQHKVEGYNGRCDALQAAVLRTKLRYLSQWNHMRQLAANQYLERLSGIPSLKLPVTGKNREHVFHLFVIQVENRETIVQGLKARGIDTGLHYPVPLHQQTAYRHMASTRKFHLPVCETVSRKIVSLPMYPGIRPEQIDYVCNNLKELLPSNEN
jgi:dTDP-4-amino-4,6-dideoxygalactose transaminase